MPNTPTLRRLGRNDILKSIERKGGFKKRCRSDSRSYPRLPRTLSLVVLDNFSLQSDLIDCRAVQCPQATKINTLGRFGAVVFLVVTFCLDNLDIMSYPLDDTIVLTHATSELRNHEYAKMAYHLLSDTAN
jgi:hypothetical protein